MIVILEGPDGSGKTTLCNNLVAKGYKHISNLPREWPEQYDIYEYLFLKLIKNYNNVVIDRSFISEIVYRIVKQDNKANINLCQILKLLKEFPIKIIYCKSDTAFQDALSRGETYITTTAEHKYLTFVYDVIIDLIRQFTDVPVIDYNWKTDKISSLLKELQNG